MVYGTWPRWRGTTALSASFSTINLAEFGRHCADGPKVPWINCCDRTSDETKLSPPCYDWFQWHPTDSPARVTSVTMRSTRRNEKPSKPSSRESLSSGTWFLVDQSTR